MRAAIGRCLQSQPLFADLPPEELAALAAVSFIQDVPAGRRLWTQGSPGDRYVLLLHGQLEARRVDAQGRECVVARLDQGQATGETSLLLGDLHDATLSAVTPCRLIVLPRPEFQELLRRRGKLARSLRPREDICQALDAHRFPWQEGDERVTLHLRQHPWALCRRLAWPILFLAAFSAAVHYLQLGFPLWAIPAGLSLLWIVALWLEWRNDALTVTTRRIVHVEKRLLAYQRQRQAPLDKVQDVAIARSGLASALFGFGQLTVQTAGASGQITFSYTPEPDVVKEAVFAEVERSKAQQRAARRQTLEADLRRQLGLTEPAAGEERVPAEPGAPGVKPEGPLDQAALQLTEMIRRGFPRLRQQEGEVIIWRKHWLVLLRDLAWPVLLATAFAGLPLAAGFSLPLPVAGAMAAVCLAWLWWQWENWRADVYILTPERIVDVESIPLRLRTSRREGNLLNIQNVTFVVPGLLYGLLNYGNVTIETAGQTGNFTFDGVYDPADVQADIFRYVENCRDRQRQAEDSEQRQALADLLAAYERLRHEMEGKLQPQGHGDIEE